MFINCMFEDCMLLRCTLSECSFHKCTVISLKSEYSQIRFLELNSCNLIGINWSELLPTGTLSKPINELRDCRLKYNNFAHMAFVKFDFSGSEILDSMFAECDLTESNFAKCCLEKTEFFKCDIRKANFCEAIGYHIDIMTNKMKNAKFSFPEVVNLLAGLGIEID